MGIPSLYEAPYLSGSAYALFVRTICPSVLAHIRKSELAGLVKMLDLSHIVHQGNKSTTARLLGRTKPSLEVFIAPQASFAVNCWASLSKCSKLRVLDLSLVSEQISFESLNQTLMKLAALTEFYLPRCSTRYEDAARSMTLRLPPRLQHLSLSGNIHGQLYYDVMRQPDMFPPTMHSMSILHCPSLSNTSIKPIFQNLAGALTTVELRDLPRVKQGQFNGVLNWLPKLASLTIALDYMDDNFGKNTKPTGYYTTHWRESKPLQSLTLVTSGQTDVDPQTAFTAVDLYQLIDERFLGRLRWVRVARSTGWESKEEGAELEALAMLLVGELDKDNWKKRRWHYEGLKGLPEGMTYEMWSLDTPLGRRMRPWLGILRDR